MNKFFKLATVGVALAFCACSSSGPDQTTEQNEPNSEASISSTEAAAPAASNGESGAAPRERHLGSIAEQLAGSDKSFIGEKACASYAKPPEANPAFSEQASARALLPGDAVDGTTVTDTNFNPPYQTRQMRQFNGKYVAIRLEQVLLDQVGVPRVRRLIDELDLLYRIKLELVGIEPDGTGLLPIVAIPATDEVCNGGYACSYLNSRRIQMVTAVLTATDGLTALSHELNHAFDRQSQNLFTADYAHVFTEIMDTMTLYYLQRDENPHPLDQGLLPAVNLPYRRFDRLGLYENYPGASWQNCINLQSCDPVGNPDAYALSVHTQSGIGVRVFELYGTDQPLKRWLNQVQSLATSRGYVLGGLSNEQRRDFLIETLSLGVQQNLSCFFDTWNWPVTPALRSTLNSLYGSSNSKCSDADGDGFTPQRYDCNDASSAVRPSATETTNSVDDDCDGAVDDTLYTESTDLGGEPGTGATLPLRSHVKGTIAAFDRDAYRVTLATPQTMRVYVRSLGPELIVDVFNAGSTTEWQTVNIGAWSSSFYRVTLPAGNWDFRVFGWTDGLYELFVQPDTSLPVEMPDGWPITYTPTVPSNPTANQYVIPAPAVPAALVGTPSLQVRHWVSNFGFVGTSAAGSSFTWNAPASTNPKALEYRSQFVTSSSGPPVWPLSQYQSLASVPNFTHQDLGTIATPGTTARWFDNFAIDGAGIGINGTADSFRYSWVKVSGDTNIVARVVSFENTNTEALAGVLIRETLSANAKMVVMAAMPGNNVRFRRRTTAGGGTASDLATLSATAPRWVRLQRIGNTFKAYWSSNGTTFTQLGSTATISMSMTVYVGLAVSSASPANLATAQVDAVALAGTVVP